jgi:hypothetical protein
MLDGKERIATFTKVHTQTATIEATMPVRRLLM